MSIYIGTKKSKLFLGDKKIKKIYVGTERVYSSGNIVTYYVDGVFYQEEVESGNSVLSPTSFTPSKDGYTFVGWSLTDGGDILSEYLMDSDPITLYAIMIQTVTPYSYNGSVQSFTAPVAGTYLLQVWGAQGGAMPDSCWARSKGSPGLGGYAKGKVTLTKGEIIYICVGGSGIATSATSGGGGYNGGGWCYSEYGHDHTTGGGATHMAKTTNRGVLKNYASYKSEVLIVAGGGGGAGGDEDGYAYPSGGSGGGTNGSSSNDVTSYDYFAGQGGGTQTAGGVSNDYGADGSFGQGGIKNGNGHNPGSGGGGGWYGGATSRTTSRYDTSVGEPYQIAVGGGGGSGYIGGVTDGSMSNGSRSGNGYASVTFVST